MTVKSFGDGTTQTQGFYVEGGKHAGVTHAARADVGIGFASKGGRAAAESLGFGQEVYMNLEPYK